MDTIRTLKHQLSLMKQRHRLAELKLKKKIEHQYQSEFFSNMRYYQ
jgi:hypothetical protein